jgi:hypothetical protein
MSRRDRTMLAGVGLLGLLAAFWFLALAPKREAARAAGDQVAAAQAHLSEAQSRLADVEAAQASYGADQATLAELGKAVPRDDDTGSLFFQLSRAAKRAGIDFRSFTLDATASPAAPAGDATASSTPLPPGAQPGADGLSELPLKFTFDGGYFELQRLLELVHGFTVADGDDVRVRGRLLAVGSVALTRGQAGFPEVKAEITAKAYLSTDDVALPTAPSAGGGAPAAPTTTAEPTQAAGTPAPPTAAITGATR